MNFKKWYLNEVGTGTNCVAVFSRPIFGGNPVGRTWPPMIATSDKDEEDSDSKKDKKKKED